MVFKKLRKEVNAIDDSGIDLAKARILVEPDSFYADFSYLSHRRQAGWCRILRLTRSRHGRRS
jgi:hypothetical protein